MKFCLWKKKKKIGGGGGGRGVGRGGEGGIICSFRKTYFSCKKKQFWHSLALCLEWFQLSLVHITAAVSNSCMETKKKKRISLSGANGTHLQTRKYWSYSVEKGRHWLKVSLSSAVQSSSQQQLTSQAFPVRSQGHWPITARNNEAACVDRLQHRTHVFFLYRTTDRIGTAPSLAHLKNLQDWITGTLSWQDQHKSFKKPRGSL